MQPYGALTLFFRWRKKSVQKKASGTATPGKRLLLPILTAGLAMSRAAELASFRLPSCALGARLFPPSKWAGLFPSAAYRRSAPPQLAVGRLTPCGLGWFPVGWPILEGHRPAGSAGASHEACRRMAVCTRQAAGSRTRPASREACRRAAVKPRPSCMSFKHPARLRRAVRG